MVRIRKTKLMGIVNVTPDSFYELSRHQTCEEAIESGVKKAQEGADILDVGGESSRPGSLPIPESLELERVLPVIQALTKKTLCQISIDTRKPSVAQAAIKAGASLINDISGFTNEQMVDIARTSGVEICVMHMQGSPDTMQKNPHYPEGIVPHLCRWFEERVHQLTRLGIREDKILLDPGIGFGKTIAHNFEILQNLLKLKRLGFPLLLGLSRKWFIHKSLNKPTSELLASTLALNALAVAAQVEVIRVHDVKEHRDVIDIMAKYHENVPTFGSRN